MSLLKSLAVKPLCTKLGAIAFVIAFTAGLSACAPEVGSDAWCKQMKNKPSGDWTANEAADYAKHCVFK
ncbi:MULTISPECIES: DUF3012 domain-containing protein [Shewanella]|uniref:DUF3012 domain-containing protein n=1 Tax=Shewanella putrefaciens (strain CN-32 / ATCC BAA-453) TaxID=319224 RepID=A4YAS4_SHEPC|nr:MULTISPECIES: DUF3012 domain-containing protein [Shewanella]CAD6366423.1 hypothetical protein SHEWT2_04030 [Shewanella hafniensis]MCA1898011.1 DUF3012 domain-containing protein [Shewanella putrefaciens]MCK7630734.1 DUF3012 domain-containing protein [Shewanella sp. JNE9-1]MCK7635381.1 DUF3012 domain-containing protein [Shewanella sp. JNE17]MCK7646036.1 DUF3012 domain-containing protein [Shewanella sp. JNE3-1]